VSGTRLGSAGRVATAMPETPSQLMRLFVAVY
jgi:hypothetical protein